MADNRYNGEQQEKGNNLLEGAAKLGAASAGGVLAFRNRAALGRTLSEAASSGYLTASRTLSKDSPAYSALSEVGLFMRATSDALGDNPSLRRTIRSGWDKNVQGKMAHDFNSSVLNNIKNRQAAALKNRPENNTTTVGSGHYNQFIKKDTNGLTDIQKKATQAFSENRIFETLGSRPIVQKHGGDSILNALASYSRENQGLFRDPQNHVSEFTKQLESGMYRKKVKFEDGAVKEAFEKELLKTLDQYKSPTKVLQANQEEIGKYVDNFSTASSFGFIQKALEQTGGIESKLLKSKGFETGKLSDFENLDIGTKRKLGLAIDEVDDKGQEKIVDVTKELRKWLDGNRYNDELNKQLKANNIDFDFNDIYLDKLLMINKESKEILDKRHWREAGANAIDALQENVKVPFLNLNPIDLTPWQSMRSGRAKDGLQVLSQGQVHGFVRNIAEDTFDETPKNMHDAAIRNPLKNSNNFYQGGNVWNFTEDGGLNLVDQGLYLTPSQYGPFSRMHDNMINYTRIEEPDERGIIRKTLDINRQENESWWKTYQKAWQKLDDPEYGPNVLQNLVYELSTKSEGQEDLVRKAYGILRVGIDRNTGALSRESAEVLAPKVNNILGDVKVNGEGFDFSRLSDDNYLKEAARAMYGKLDSNAANIGMHTTYRRNVYKNDGKGKDIARETEDPAVAELRRWTEKYLNDPVGFASAREASVDRRLPSGADMFIPSLADNEPLVPATEKLRRAFHQYAMRAVDNEEGDFTTELVKSGVRRRSSLAYLEEAGQMGLVSQSDVKNAKDLELLTDLLGYKNINEGGARKAEAYTFLEDMLNFKGKAVSADESSVLFEGGAPTLTGVGMDLQEGILRAQPKWGRKPEASPPALNGADFILMRKSGLGKAGRNVVSDLNLKHIGNESAIYDGWDLAHNIEMYGRRGASTLVAESLNVGKEMMAGRYSKGDSLENVTTSTAIMYGLAERLDNQLGNFGGSLSRQNMGNFASIIGNQYGRRIALPIAAYQQAVYFDGLTGDAVSDGAADTYVAGHESLAQVKDILGINKALQPLAGVFKNAGGDQVKEWLGVKQLDFATMGLFSDFRSSEEVRDYYESGEVAIRKNRYWGIGSPSPWAGGGIDHFEANWYRKLKSDYKFSDTMYGDEGEYWANHWMPTLTNPLAPIKHFITDPYHYEKKHQLDRPAAITGGFSEIQNIPLIGTVVDGTVGRILKPRVEHKGLEKAHEEYIAAINQKIQDQYSAVHDGSYVSVSGTGAVEQFSMYGNQGTGEIIGGAAAVYGADVGVVNYGNAFTTIAPNANQASGGLGMLGRGRGGGSGGSGSGLGGGIGSGTGAGIAREILARENFELAMQGDGEEVGTVGSMQKAQNSLLPMNLNNIITVDNLQGMLTDGFYSGSELAGIYGFMTKTGIGYDESWRGTTLQSSSQMTSASRSFWDANLGGAGGALSEIGRRYVPRDPNKEYYSPIRNTMPDWMPGIGESIDFMHGDPYVKIQKGEIRLPGEAYERLYKLNPDGTGTGQFANYGIVDRFRILGDVDPDGEQFKVAKHQIALMREAGRITPEMDKEIKEVKRQVSAKQDTYRWYDKKFSNADIIKQDVTVSEIIDGNTFMVREHDAPIKLAGIKLTQKDNQDVIEWMGQYLKVGEKIQIGIADDPISRYNKDTYGSMDAVVYTNKNEEGRFWFETSKGQSLNSIIATKKWQNPVEVQDDGSATATRALYANDMVTIGKYTEMLTHDILPKVPFVGIIADKFLQVRTPVESYKRDQVYGTDWRPWTHPYEAWIKPMVNTVASQNPLLAGAEMAAIGHLWGRTPKSRGIGRIAGFAVGAGFSSLRVFGEGAGQIIPGGDNVWIPQNREDEREINQYFDRLKYVKFRGLYERANELARQEEGVDVDEFFAGADEKGRKNKGLKRYLTDRKKTLSLSKKMGYGDAEAIDSLIDDYSLGINTVDGAKEAYKAGRFTSLAIKYREEYEGTLYNIGQEGASDRTALMRALTPKEREYVPRFMETTNSKERREILKYVPEDVKRVLQGSWGLEQDKAESIDSYFNKHYLPGEDWTGWSAGTNLDDIKIKVMQKQDVNPTASGYWGKDQARAENSGAKAIPMNSLSSLVDRNRLSEVLSGLGLSDVDVQLTTSYGEGNGGINTSINIMKDVRKEVLDVFNDGASTLF